MPPQREVQIAHEFLRQYVRLCCCVVRHEGAVWYMEGVAGELMPTRDPQHHADRQQEEQEQQNEEPLLSAAPTPPCATGGPAVGPEQPIGREDRCCKLPPH